MNAPMGAVSADPEPELRSSMRQVLINPTKREAAGVSYRIALCALFLVSPGCQKFSAPPSKPAPRTTAQPRASPAPVYDHHPEFEAWRRSMTRVPTKGAKCRKAVYPSHAWQEIPCEPAKKHPLPTRGAIAPSLVGGTSGDFQAKSANTILSAQGLFAHGSGITDVTSVATSATSPTDPCSTSPLPNEYSIQLNSNTFSTSACTTSGCVGWQQFVFDNSRSGSSVYMQYWLIGYGPNCPQPWWQSGNDCYRNSDEAGGPFQDVSKLAEFRLYATAADPNAGGRDSFYVHLPTGEMIGTTGDANVLGLKAGWNSVEFNVFGNACSRQANFNAGVNLLAVLNYLDNTSQLPTCAGGSTTAEMNSLTLVRPCCTLGGPPGIMFTESNLTGAKSLCDCPLNSSWDPHKDPAQCVCKDPSQIIINGQCQIGCSPSCPDCTEADLDDGCGGICPACNGSCCSGICCNAGDTCCSDTCCRPADVCGGPGYCHPG